MNACRVTPYFREKMVVRGYGPFGKTTVTWDLEMSYSFQEVKCAPHG